MLVVVMTTYLKMISQNVADVERRFKVSFKENAEYHKDIQGPEKGVHPLANYWQTSKDWHQCLGRLTLGDGGMNLLHFKYLQAHSLHVFLDSSYDFCCILGSYMIIYTWSRGFDVRLGCTNWCSKRLVDVVSEFSEVCIPMKFLVVRNVKCGGSLHSNERFWLQEL